MNWVKKYQKINKKERKLVFYLAGFGFGYEVGALLLSAVLYCLDQEIEFVLDSRDWTGTHNRGWEDYFLPFCQKHHRRNWEHFFLRFFNKMRRNKSSWIWRLLLFTEKKLSEVIFRSVPFHTVLPVIHSRQFKRKNFNIPALGIEGDLFHAKQRILEIVYRHNDEINTVIDAQNETLNNFKPYISVHIRRGDKIAEVENTEIVEYIDKIKQNTPTNINNIFIASDDHSAIQEFKKICPSHWNIKTFCTPHKKGHDSFMFSYEKNKKIKKQHMIDLFIDIHLLKESEFFIGTHTSNVGRFIALFKGKDKCHSVTNGCFYSQY